MLSSLDSGGAPELPGGAGPSRGLTDSNLLAGPRQGFGKAVHWTEFTSTAGHCSQTFPKETMDSNQFRELHTGCLEALRRYVREADRTCELFGKCLAEPSSLQTHSEIIEQRVRENNALASYLKIRRQLFAAVRTGYGSSN